MSHTIIYHNWDYVNNQHDYFEPKKNKDFSLKYDTAGAKTFHLIRQNLWFCHLSHLSVQSANEIFAIYTSSTASGPPVSPLGSVGDKRLPPASIAPQGEGYCHRQASPSRRRLSLPYNKLQIRTQKRATA